MSARHPCRLLALLALLGLAGPLSGQEGRFAGWAHVADQAYRFDPDLRPVLGFSVQAPGEARAGLDAARAELERGDAQAAARRWLGLVRAARDDVVQVQSNPPRWVGAAEWSLYLLRTRVPAALRERLAAAEDEDALRAAVRWRDTDALGRLSWRLAGLPQASRLLSLRARLLAERGDRAGAGVAALRALEAGAATSLSALLSVAPTPLAGDRPRLPQELAGLWPPRPITPAWLPREKPPPRVSPSNPFQQERRRYDAPMSPVLPVVADGVIHLADSVSVEAVNAYSGRVLWHYAGPMEQLARNGSEDAFPFGVYANRSRPRAVSPWQMAAPTVTRDMVLATVQVPEQRTQLHWFEGIPNHWPLPRRRVVALDRATGEVLWRQERPGLGPGAFINRLDVHGPPAVEGGRVYVTGSVTEGAIHAWVAALDLATGDLVWRTYLCSGQQELTMFNRAFQEHVTSPPLVRDGSLWVCTNLGLVACVDSWSGRVRWLTGYPTATRRAARTPYRNAPRDVLWTNHAPVLEAGRLLVTPLDGLSLLALDPHTGRQAWEIPSQPYVRRIGGGTRSTGRHDFVGTGQGSVVVAGDRVLEAFDAASGEVLWAGPDLFGSSEGEIEGPLVVAGERLLVPTSWGLFALDPRTGATLDSRDWPDTGGARAVVAVGALVVMADAATYWAALDVPRALRLGRQRAAGSLAARLDLGELLLGLDRFDEASVEFEAVRDDPGAAPLARRARGGLLQAALQRARHRHTARSWEHALGAAAQEGLLAAVAPEALPELALAGAHEAVERWLEELAALHPAPWLELDALTPDGPQPAALVLARRRLPGDRPKQAVARLQDLILRFPDAPWNGRDLWSEASARIAELLAEHGQELFAPFERMAARELGRADDALSLDEAERRYPNARAVLRRRIERWREQVGAGQTAWVFEEIGAYLARGAQVLQGADLRAVLTLRAETARQLGEVGFAAALEGRPEPLAVSRPPALPGPGASPSRHEISRHPWVVLPAVEGAWAEDLAGRVLGCVNGEGTLFLFDTQADRVAWRRPLPGAAPSVAESDTFLVADDLLVAYCRRGRDTLEGVSLRDGSRAWSRRLPGALLRATVASGLVLTLTMVPEQGYRLDGWGLRTGMPAMTRALGGFDDVQLVRAGPHVVLRTRAADGVRLLELDLATGHLAALTTSGFDLQYVEGTLDDPPTLLLEERGRAGVMLVAFDPARAEVRWRVPLPASTKVFQPVGPETVLLRQRDHSVPGGPARDEVTLVDLRTGAILPSPQGGTTIVVTEQDAGAPGQVLLQDTSPSVERYVLLDTTTGKERYAIDLGTSIRGSLSVVHALDGVVLASDSYDQILAVSVATLQVTRGAHGEERYSFEVRSARNDQRLSLALTDGALVLARGGTLWSITGGER